jgi:hypothetical protein
MTFEGIRYLVTENLTRCTSALAVFNKGDKEFVDKQMLWLSGLGNVIERAKTPANLWSAQKRLSNIVNVVSSRLPNWYFSQECQNTVRAHYSLLFRRNNLVKRLRKDAPWLLEPYRLDTVDSRRGIYEQSMHRICIAIPAERRAEITEKIDLLEIEAEIIAEMFSVAGVNAERRMRLPVLTPAGFRKLVFSENKAHSVLPINISTLKYRDGSTEYSLDVDDFLAEQGWRRDQVTIRRSSGSRYAARLWDADGNSSRIQTNCVLVDYSADLPQRVFVQQSRAPRLDAKIPAATWYCYDFIYYPDGRPKRAKRK